MPRVEIHGLGPDLSKKIRERIFELLNWKDLQVTIVNDDTTDRTGALHPFLCVWVEDRTDNLSVLAGLGMRMEFPPTLSKVVPAKKDFVPTE